MGNSEVGHMNIGAGRVVYQDLLRIDRAVADGSFAQEPVLSKALVEACQPGRRLHLMGLVCKGGVHSQQAHLHALVDAAEAAGVTDCVIHAFTDGRDTAPQMGLSYIQELKDIWRGSMHRLQVSMAVTMPMDRDKRWERVKRSYAALVETSTPDILRSRWHPSALRRWDHR